MVCRTDGTRVHLVLNAHELFALLSRGLCRGPPIGDTKWLFYLSMWITRGYLDFAIIDTGVSRRWHT